MFKLLIITWIIWMASWVIVSTAKAMKTKLPNLIMTLFGLYTMFIFVETFYDALYWAFKYL